MDGPYACACGPFAYAYVSFGRMCAY
jgi:hypothetical protein